MAIKWTEKEKDFLIQNYKLNGALYCYEHLDRELYAIRRKAQKMNLTKKGYKYDKKEIEDVVKESKNYKECLLKLNIRAAGGNYKQIQKWIKGYNISIEHFETQSERFQKNVISFNKKPLIEILVENSTYNTRHLKDRLYKEELKKRECELCGQGEEWRGEKMALILDHKNGIHNDHRKENLRIVCPNCNATLPTHAGKNNKKKQ